jgi:histone H3/H4
MAKRPYFIAKAPIKNIFRAAGVRRVSEQAIVYLRDEVENLVRKVAELALEYAHHAGRKSVKKEDVRLALEVILKKKE